MQEDDVAGLAGKGEAEGWLGLLTLLHIQY